MLFFLFLHAALSGSLETVKCHGVSGTHWNKYTCEEVIASRDVQMFACR